MSLLQDFLAENQNIDEIKEEVAISPRFKDKDGNLLKFKIRPMSGDEFGMFQKACTKINMNGKKRETSFDSGKYNVMCIVNCCLDPDFRNAEFLKKVGAVTPEQAVSKVLLAGEIVELGNQISSLSGFDIDINEEIEKAKN